jgi:hypothetical protein
MVRAPWCPLTSSLRLYKASDTNTLNQSAFSRIKFRSAIAIEDLFHGIEVSVPAPWRDEELPPGAISIDSIDFTTISIDFTTISIDVAVSHDEERVVLPWG